MAITNINMAVVMSFLLSTLVEASSGSSSSGPAVPVKWFIFREDCFDTFFVNHDFFNKECLKFTISKYIGYNIIAGAFIVKVPQILKIAKSKSVEGISKWLYYIDVSIINKNSQFILYYLLKILIHFL